MPKGAPAGDVRSVTEYTDFELKACLEHADHLLRDLPPGSDWRPRLLEWRKRMLAEREARIVQREADARAAAERLKAGR